MKRRVSAIARERALMRLRDLHPTQYATLYAEELAALDA